MTPEELQKIIRIDVQGGGALVDFFGGAARAIWDDAEVAEGLEFLLHAAIKGAETDAVAAHLASVVPEGPVSESRLEQIREALTFDLPPGSPPLHDTLLLGRELLAAHDHLRSLLARLVNDSHHYDAGREQGRREKAKEVAPFLKGIEWSGMNRSCPCCDFFEANDGKHADGCRLAAALKEAT